MWFFDAGPFAAAVIVAIVAYGIYRAVAPAAPRHHVRFLLLTAVLTFLESLFIYYKAGHFQRVFLASALCCAAGYTVYRLVMLAPERPRVFIAAFVAALLSVALPLDVYSAYDKLARPRCCSKRLEGMAVDVLTAEYPYTFFNLPVPHGGCPCYGPGRFTGEERRVQ